jgi:hypothetical protein
MDKLLKAMQEGKDDLVCRLASDLFITRNGEYNQAQMNEFAQYAPCKVRSRVVQVRGMDIKGGWIQYNDQIFYFG